VGSPGFLTRNEFFVRRLHSFLGLFPVGVYVMVHLTTNASILNGPATFQGLVYQIHSLERALWIVEWSFIFLPLLFHAVIGVWLSFEGRPNNTHYKYANNFRYTMQRATGMIAFVFIVWHVFHLHGWIHLEAWMDRVTPFGGGLFRPFNAATSGHDALTMSPVVPILYALGVLATTFHLANGIWTAGITWGLWVTPQAQRRANWLAGAIFVALSAVGLSAIYGFVTLDTHKARTTEDAMYEAKVAAHEIQPNDEKRSEAHDDDPGRGPDGAVPGADDKDRPPRGPSPEDL